MRLSPELKSILFLDIETVACQEYYESLEAHIKPLWEKKAYQLKERDKTLEHLTCEELFDQRGGIHAEFGRIVAIGLGCLRERKGIPVLTVKSLASANEQNLLQRFNQIIANLEQYLLRQCTANELPEPVRFCAHNGKEFDFPYLARRIIINHLPLPAALRLQGKKPWDIPHLDTMEMWKFGDRKSFTSLDLLAATFGIPSSKTEMDGSLVGDIFYKERNLGKIARYCALDVVNVAQVYLRLNSLPLIEPEYIEIRETEVPG
jgi:3'-5' exonuclease